MRAPVRVEDDVSEQFAILADQSNHLATQSIRQTVQNGQFLAGLSTRSNASRLPIRLPTNLWRAEMRRREFIAGLGGAAVWPVVGRAQQGDRVRRIGYLNGGGAEVDTPRRTAFVQVLQQLGWTVGRNVRLEERQASGNRDLVRKYAEELVAQAPDVILAVGGGSVGPLQQVTRTIPIVFVQTADPVGNGFVRSLARPGGNATGFLLFEYSLAGKWPELLKQIAPAVTRVGALRDPGQLSGMAQLGVIQAVAAFVRIEVTPIDVRDVGEMESGIAEFARAPNSGLIVLSGFLAGINRGAIITLAARHRLPAVYSSRVDVADGGLIAYGPDTLEQFRLAAGYVESILKGEKPADLPVQAPTKYELAINLKTAKALGLTVPQSILLRADEVIE
jgi:putative tryptophan/tyrosine transport system substrate-binding protein